MLAFNNDIPPFLELVAAGYTMQYGEHGPSPTGVLWKDEEGQKQRFETLCGLVEEDSAAEVSINDLGCGYGALFLYLNEIKFNQGNFRYYGADICRDMVMDTRRRIIDARAQFQWSYQVKQRADYSLLSGTFNMKGTAEDTDWTDYIHNSLKHLFANSSKGLGFNLHDAKQKKRLEWTYYANRAKMVTFCKRELSKDLQIIEDKKKKEFTILIRK